MLNIVSFLELVYTAACINQLLLTGKERMALVADVNFQCFHVFRGTRLKSRAARANYGNLVIFGMYFGLHNVHLALFLLTLHYYNKYIRHSQLIYPDFNDFT